MVQLSKALFFIVLGLSFAGGLAFGVWRFGSNEKSAETPIAEKLHRHDELQSLLEQASKDLANASESEKLAKVEKLLGEIFKLFLVDVSLRLQQVQQNSAEVTPQTAPTPTHSDQNNSPKMAATSSARPAPSTSAATKDASAAPAWPVLDIRIVEAANQQALKQALDALAAENVLPRLDASKPVNEEASRLLFGEHQGRIVFGDAGRPPWGLRLRVEESPKSTPEKLVYKYEIRLTKGKGSVSRSTGEGDLRSFTLGSGENAPYFIDLKEEMLMLYPSPKYEAPGFVGLFYEAQGRSQLVPVGRIQLTRQ